MPPKTLFVPKEFTNELTDLIEKNPTVESVLCHSLLSQTCRNEGLKFLNFFYTPEELEKETANLPNLDHLIDLALDKDATVDVPEDASNSIGQINRNASNILSGPSKRLRDLAMKDPQRRIFRKLRGFVRTKSAKNTMFAGHFQRILENYLNAYDSEFKPQTKDFYNDDFSMKELINFMIKHIKILAYRDFLTHFVTLFAKAFPDDSNYALEEILSRAGRYLFALQDLQIELKNQLESSNEEQIPLKEEKGENAEDNENSSENDNENKKESSSNSKDIINKKYIDFCSYEEKIQPISIEEKRLPLPIYMNTDPSKKVPPFIQLYTEYQNYLEDFQLSHPTKRSNKPPPLPTGKPLPPTPAAAGAAAAVQGSSQPILSNRNKRSTAEPDFFKKNSMNNKKRNNQGSYKIPGLLNLDELDPKKKSKTRETQSSFDMINRQSVQKQSNYNNRRSVNFSKADMPKFDEKEGNNSDSEIVKKNGKLKKQRSHSLKTKSKPFKTKGKDDKKGKKGSDVETASIEEIYLENDSSKDDSNRSIIYHYNATNRRFSSMEDFETTMKDFVHYDEAFITKLEKKKKKNKFSSEIARQSIFFLISLVRNAFGEDTDFYRTFRKNEALIQLLLICGTFCDDDSRLSSEVFTIVKTIFDGDGKEGDEENDKNDRNDSESKSSHSNDVENDNGRDNDRSGGNNGSGSVNNDSENDSEGEGNKNEKSDTVKKRWQVPDFVADFAEYFTFDPFNVTQKMIAAFQIFWNYRSIKYDVYDDFCYSRYLAPNRPNNDSNLILQKEEKDLILDYPSFEGRIYRKPPGKTPLEVMTPVFFTEPPLSDSFNHTMRKILTNLGEKRHKLAGENISKSEHIEEILQIDIIYIEFMRNTFDLSLDNPDFQRLHVINAVEKMLEMYPCNNNYWQNHNTIARPMLNGHIEKLSKWSMKYDFLVVGKNKELSNIAFLLPGPKAATAANYAQTTFDIDNLIARFKNKLFKIDLGWPSSESTEEEDDYEHVSELDF